MVGESISFGDRIATAKALRGRGRLHAAGDSLNEPAPRSTRRSGIDMPWRPMASDRDLERGTFQHVVDRSIHSRRAAVCVVSVGRRRRCRAVDRSGRSCRSRTDPFLRLRILTSSLGNHSCRSSGSDRARLANPNGCGAGRRREELFAIAGRRESLGRSMACWFHDYGCNRLYCVVFDVGSARLTSGLAGGLLLLLPGSWSHG